MTTRTQPAATNDPTETREGQVYQPTGREGPGRPWYIRFRHNGTRVARRAMLPPVTKDGPERPAETEDEAVQALKHALRVARETEKSDAQRGCAERTFESFRTEYRPGGTSARHARIVAAQLKRAAARDHGNLGHVPMHRIDANVAQRYVDGLKAAGCGPSTVRRHLAALSGCWEAAIRAGCAKVNPWHVGELSLDDVMAPTIRFRSATEVAKMIRACPKPFRPLVRFIAATGCRYEEAAGMTWDEVVSESLVTIPAERTKRKRVRHIRVEGDARKVLDEMRRAHVVPMDGARDYVFALRPATEKRPARVYSHGYVYKQFTEALKKVKIPDARPFHSLRNSVASRMVLAGVPLSVVAEAIGDSLQVTAQRYAHLVPDDAVARAYQATARRREPRSAPARSASA